MMSEPKQAAAQAENRGSLKGRAKFRDFLLHYPAVFTLLLIILISIVVGAINPNFWQLSTLFDMLRSSVVTGLFALGVLIVLAAGGLDVSFTAIAAFTMYAITVAVLNHAPTLSIGVIMLVGRSAGRCSER
jgi:simple sugar transport system permease protein